MLKIIRPFILSLLVLVVGFLFSAGTLAAQADSPFDRLNLTDGQKVQIKQLKEKFKAETESLRADIRKLLDEEKQLKTTQNNEAALRVRMKQRADKEIELSLALTRFNKNLEAILTPEQRKQLENMRTQRQIGQPLTD